MSFSIQGTGIGAFNGKRDGLGVTWNGIPLTCFSVVLDLNADNTMGRIGSCVAPNTPGTGTLHWYYDFDAAHVEFGTLTVLP